MNREAATSIWNSTFKTRLYFSQWNKIEQWEITTTQFQYLILEYKKENVYANGKHFLLNAEEFIKAGVLPDDLLCRGLLSSNESVIGWVEDIQALERAWIPDDKIAQEIADLREILEKHV